MNENNLNRIRTLQLLTLSETDTPAIQALFANTSGVAQIKVDASTNTLFVQYDMSKISYQQLINRLNEEGFIYKNTLWNHIKKAWIQYVDQIAHDNSQAQPKACCNRPPRSRR